MKPLPKMSPRFIRETRTRLNMSRGVFAVLMRVKPRTLERWEQGRSRPNDQAVALLLLVRRFPETLAHLESLGT
jgi:putative transcriptional regulator